MLSGNMLSASSVGYAGRAGQGESGAVYRGLLDHSPVAIKKVKEGGEGGAGEGGEGSKAGFAEVGDVRCCADVACCEWCSCRSNTS